MKTMWEQSPEALRHRAREGGREGGKERWMEAGKGEQVRGFGKHEVSVSRVKPV